MDDIKKPDDLDEQPVEADFAEDVPTESFDDGMGEDDMGGGEDFTEEEGFAEESFDDGDEAFSEEEWDTYDEDFMEEGGHEEAPAKKKSSNTLILVIGVIAAVGVGGFQFLGGGGGSPAPNTELPQPTPTSNTQPTLPKGAATAQQGVPETDIPPAFGVAFGEEPEPISEAEQTAKKGGLLNNPDALRAIEEAEAGIEYEYVYEEVPLDDDLPMPGTADPVIEESNVAPPLMPIPDIGTTASDSSSMPRMPEMDDIAKAQPVTDIMPSDTAQQPQTSPFDSPATANTPDNTPRETVMRDDNVAQELNSKLDTLLNRIETIESRLDDVASMQRSLTTMERQVKTLSADMKRVEKKAASAPQSAPVSRSYEAAKTAPKTTAAPATSQTTTSSVNWSLKSAQPGQALVGRAGSNDVVDIKVGDSLQGIGKITAIAKENGKWVVSGTRGRIEQ